MTANVHVGWGVAAKLREILTSLGCRRLFLVTGRASYESCGAAEKLGPILAGYDVVRFSIADRYVTLERVLEGMDVFRKTGRDGTIAVGGGTVMDVAKAVSHLAVQSGDPAAFVRGEKSLERDGPPLMVIPTTSGSGSEATPFAVVYISKTKYSLDHPFVLPDAALVDAQLTLNLPPAITAATGIDALSQAMEAAWSVHSTEASRMDSKEAVTLAWSHLEDAVRGGARPAREAMARASHLAGRAIAIARTTAAHSVSYPITAHFNVPHGHAVGLTLPYFFPFNAGVDEGDVVDARGVDHVRGCIDEIAGWIGASSPQEACDLILERMRAVGLSTVIPGLDDAGVGIIVENGFNPARVRNNPRRLTREQLRVMVLRLRS